VDAKKTPAENGAPAVNGLREYHVCGWQDNEVNPPPVILRLSRKTPLPALP